MKAERRILRSTSILFGAQAVSQLANFMFVILLARAFGPPLLGEYSFALSLGSILAVLVSLGTNGLLLRRCSRDPTQWLPHVGFMLPAHLSLAATVWLVTIGGAALIGVDHSQLRIIAAIILFPLLSPTWSVFTIGFTATERMGYAAMADAGARILILAVCGIAIWWGVSIEYMLLVFPASSFVVLIVLARLAIREFGRPHFRISLSSYVSVVREALPFLGILALTVLYGRIGILLLRSMTDAAEVGLFASAERLVMAAGMLQATFGQAIYPPLVRLFTKHRDQFHRLVDRSTRLLILLTLPVATLLHLFAHDLTTLLFGAKYVNSSGILQLLAWLIAVRGITTIMNNIGMACDKQRSVLLSNVLGTATLVAGALVLVPASGATGLAIAALLAQTSKLLFLYITLRPTGYLPSVVRIGLPVALACAGTLLVAELLSEAALLIRAIGTAACGTLFLYLFRAVHIHDFVYAYHILSTRSERDRGDSKTL